MQILQGFTLGAFGCGAKRTWCVFKRGAVLKNTPHVRFVKVRSAQAHRTCGSGRCGMDRTALATKLSSNFESYLESSIFP